MKTEEVKEALQAMEKARPKKHYGIILDCVTEGGQVTTGVSLSFIEPPEGKSKDDDPPTNFQKNLLAIGLADCMRTNTMLAEIIYNAGLRYMELKKRAKGKN